MAWHWLLRAALANAAKQKLYETAEEVVRERLRPQDQSAEDGGDDATPLACDVGVVFATKAESGGLYDLLEEARTLAGDAFTIHLGRLRERRVAVVQSGAGYQAAARATQTLIDGHHPRYVIAAGFADALQIELRPGQLVLASHIVDETHEFATHLRCIPEAAKSSSEIHVGRLLTLENAPQTAAEREALGRRYGVLAFDHESLGLAEVCQREGVPFVALRVVRHALHETAPADIRHLTKQHSLAGRLGAALGAVARRPSSVKDMWQLKEDALIASDRLARCVAEIVVSGEW